MPLKQSIPVRLRYGCGQEFSCEVESNRVSVFRPGPAELSSSAARKAIQKALASPLGLPTLDQALVPDDHVVIALDRQERGQGERSAIQEVESDYGMPVSAIVRLEQLIAYLDEKGDADSLQRIRAYRETYGV